MNKPLAYHHYPLASGSWGKEELDAIQRTINRGTYTMGSGVIECEKNFSVQVGSRFAVMVNSGSSANLLMVASLFFTKEPQLRAGDEVLVPAVSWSTSYYPLTQYGLKLRFVDIDIHTLNYDLEKLESAITAKTRAVLAVNLLGNPNEFEKINSILKGRNIILLEDNCESLGASINGKQTGTWGLMGTFSSFFSHHISTMEGGFIVTDNEELYQILICLRAHGWTRQLPDENYVSGRKSKDPFDELFKFILPGYNVRPLEMSGMIGIEQIKKINNFITIRRENGSFFKELFRDHPDFMIQKEVGNSSWFGFSLIIRNKSNLKRKNIVQHLNQYGIECRPIVGGNFVKNPVMKWLDHTIHGDLEAANYLDEKGFFVGNQEIDLKQSITHLNEVLNPSRLKR